MPKTVEGGTLRFLNIHSVAKYQKLKGEPSEILKIFDLKNENFEQSHSAEKSERDPLGFFNIRSVAKYQKMKGDPLGTLKNFRKKSQSRKGEAS